MNEFYVSHNQLLIILLIILLGVGIFSYAMLKHAIELRNRTTQIVEDLSIVQGYIDVELAAKLLQQQITIDEQQIVIDLLSLDQNIQNSNLEKLYQNSNVTYENFDKILNNENPNVDTYYQPLPII